MSTSSETTNSTYFFATAMIGLACAVIYKFVQKTGEEVIKETLIQVGKFFLGVAIVVGIVLLVIARYRKKRKEKEDRRSHEHWHWEKKLEEIKEQKYYSLAETRAVLAQLKAHEEEIIASGNAGLLRTVRASVSQYEDLFLKQKREQEAYWAQKVKNKPDVDRLARHFVKRDSTQSIPSWAIHFSEAIIKDAEEEYAKQKQAERKTREEKNHHQYLWEKAAEFVAENKEYPKNYRDLQPEEREQYTKAMRMLSQGTLPKINREEDDDDALEDLRDSRFYHADKLKEEQKRALFAKGYRFIPFISLDGKTGNNLIIYNNKKKESDYHYCLKQLFAELHEDTRVEFPVRDLRVDIMFEFGNKEVAVEIETGKNKRDKIQQKVPALNSRFDYWIFVCSRTNKKKYRKFVDGKTSFCLTVKEARDKLKALAAAEGHTLQ